MSNITQTISNIEPTGVKVVTKYVPQAEKVAQIESRQGSEETCPSCGAAQVGLAEHWCKKCGYYPKLAIKLDLDECDKDSQKTTEQEAPKPTLWSVIPYWVYLLLAGITVLGMESLACHFLYKPDSWPRTRWSLTQLFAGFAVFAVFHTWVFVRECMKSGKVAIVDFFINPYAVWEDVLADANKHGWKIAFAGQGIAAMVLSVIVIGSIPYGEAFNWGFKPRPKKNLSTQIAAAMPGGDEEMSLEEAIEKMSGLAEGMKPEEKKEEKPVEKDVECVVIGYLASTSDKPELTTLFVASDFKGKFQYTGSISTDVLKPKERRELLAKLKKLERDLPIVKVSASATWVHPVVTCRVVCHGYTDKGRLVEPLLREMLADVNIGRK